MKGEFKMEKTVLYQYIGTNGIILSPVHLEDTYYIRKLSLKANKGCILTNGEIYRKNITIPEEDLDLWFEVEDLGQT